MSDPREVTEADLDATLAWVFGHGPAPVSAAVSEAEAKREAIYAKAFGRKPRGVTEADLDATLAATFGYAGAVDPARSTMTLAEAEDVSIGAVFGRPNLTAAMVREAEAVIAYHAAAVGVVEAEPGMTTAEEAQLEAARLRAASAAASQGRTASEATGYSQALLTHVQTRAVAEGRSFAEVIDLIDRVAESLRKTPRTR